MRRLFFILLVCSFSCSAWQAESPSSGVIIPKILSTQQQKNLNILCRVWGFIKYFHPKVADGKVEMDKELFRLIPGILSAADDTARDQLLDKWVQELGELTLVDSMPLSRNGFIEPDFKWLEKDSLIEGALRIRLQYVFKNRHRGESYYVHKVKNVGNLEFSTEIKYEDIKGEDAGMRILALFRYWNAIEYFFPSKQLTADNWNKVLQKFIPLFASCKTDLDYRITCLQLVSTIHDTHASNISGDPLIQDYLGEYAIPADFGYVDGQMTLNYFFSDYLQSVSNLLPGDQILQVNGHAINDIMMDSIKQYVTASNISSLTNIVMNRIRRSNHKRNELIIKRGDEKIKLEVDYLPVYGNGGPKTKGRFAYPMYQKIQDSIGYICVGKIKIDSLSQIFERFQKTKGLIIDIRLYPAEFVPFALAKYLKPTPSAFVKFTEPDLDLPGRFIMTDPLVNGQINPDYYKGKIVILVDGWTQSQAEYTTMALRTAPGAVVMGSQTSGADGNVTNIFLPGGMSSYFSGLGVYYPDGQATQGIGIIPDIEVKPTLEGIREEKDELLEAAIKYIQVK